MLRIFVITLISFIYTNNIYSQNFSCDRSIEWDLDADTIKKELPYNQTICFRLKSKNLDLKTFRQVIFLRLIRNKSGIETLEKIKKRNNLNKWQLYPPTIYDDSLKALKAYLIDENQSRPLLPGHRYQMSIFKINPIDSIKSLFEALYLFANTGENDDNWVTYRNNAYQIFRTDSINAVHNNGETETTFQGFNALVSTFTISPTNTASLYSTHRRLSELRDSAIHFYDTLGFDPSYFYDNCVTFVLKTINKSDRNLISLNKTACQMDSCKLFNILLNLHHLSQDQFNNVLQGNVTVLDLNTNLTINRNVLTYEQKRRNIDSTILQLVRLRGYLENARINNLQVIKSKHGKLLLLGSNHYSEQLDPCYQGLMNSLSDLLWRLSQSRGILTYLINLRNQYDDALRSFAMSGTSFPLVTGNTYLYNFQTRNALSIVPYFGYAAYGFQKNFTSFLPYTGIQISFAPLDDNVPFNLLRRKTILQRLVFITGITLGTIKQANERDNFFGNGSNLITGLGLKLNHVVTLSSGALWFKRVNPDPFISRTSITCTPYISLNINLKLKQLFDGFTGLIPSK